MKKLDLIQNLPHSRAKRLMNQWSHPVSVMLRAREHAAEILGGMSIRSSNYRRNVKYRSNAGLYSFYFYKYYKDMFYDHPIIIIHTDVVILLLQARRRFFHRDIGCHHWKRSWSSLQPKASVYRNGSHIKFWVPVLK